ncbi:MAG: DUF1987 domain-containing protein [Cryomorphaceae bacterium]|nr:MAG: DUF1987 domain-containing protein [Cryomorphaceae bacterium]
MSTYTTQETEKTPAIHFDGVGGKLELKGKSVPEDSFKFFQPMHDWLDQYIENPAKETELNVALEYFNTSSAKVLLEVFKKMNRLHQSGKTQLTINWVYEEDDDDMLEAGQDYQSIVEVPMNFVAIDSF